METLEPWYVTGLLEAAGTFTFARSHRQIVVLFAISLPAEARPLAESLRSFLGGAGRIFEPESRCYYRINRATELLRMVEHLDRHPLRGPKRRVYAVWREMAVLRAAHHGSAPPKELVRLVDRLKRRRA